MSDYKVNAFVCSLSGTLRTVHGMFGHAVRNGLSTACRVRRHVSPVTCAALRVGAVNGDSRPKRRLRTEFDPPLLVSGSPLDPDAPMPSRGRAEKENKARLQFLETQGPGRGPNRQWAGDVCEGPAAKLLHTLRARWLQRMRRDKIDKPITLTDDVVKLYDKLIREILICDECYYGPNPTQRMRDEEYDELVMHLLELESRFPELRRPDSPSQLVGHAAAVPRGDDIVTPLTLATALSQRFPPFRHAGRMLSLANAYTPDDIKAFLARATKMQLVLERSKQEDANISEKQLSEVLDVKDKDLSVLRSSVPPCCVEIKVDGVALSLSYREGKLVSGATRGDGIIGDDITENVRAALIGRGVPEFLPEMRHVDIRGEVYIRPDEFAQLSIDEEVRLHNPRNAAAGALKHKDPQESSKRMLRFVAYDCLLVHTDCNSSAQNTNFEEEGIKYAKRCQSNEASNETLAARYTVTNYWPSQEETIAGLQSWGLEAMPIYKFCRDLQEIQEFAVKVEAQRKELPFEADGVVVKINNSELRQAMGSTSKSPRGAIALKFAAVGAVTTIEAVEMQVSRIGVITPVAVLSPVAIGGVTISRATLHNFDEVDRLNVAVNDKVLVQRGGDVIPKIKEVRERASENMRKPITVPEKCPSCSGPVTVNTFVENATTVTCQNVEQCTAQELGRLIHFSAKHAMDISGLGIKTLQRLLFSKLVASPADLFALDFEALMRLEKIGPQSASNLLRSIDDAASNRSLERLIIGLGVPGIGRASAKQLALMAETIDGLINLGHRNRDDLLHLPNIAEKSADAVHEFFRKPRIVTQLNILKRYVSLKSVVDDPNLSQDISHPYKSSQPESSSAVSGIVTPNETEAVASVFAGKCFVFTGKMENLIRPAAMQIIRQLGGRTASAVSKKTDYVVYGANRGVKYQKALRIKVPTLAEEDLLEMLTIAVGRDIVEEKVVLR